MRRIVLSLAFAIAFLAALPASAQQFPPPSGSSIACTGTPGNTVGTYRQQCQTSTGAVWTCNNSAGCTVAADWTTVSGSGGPPSGTAGGKLSGSYPNPGVNLASGDIPALAYLTSTSCDATGANWLTCTVSSSTTTPVVTLGAATGQTSHQVIGTGSGTSFGPVTLAAGDIPFLTGIIDINYATFPLACTAAAGGTLYVTQVWTALTIQSCAANLIFTTGTLQPASAQVITFSGTINAPYAQIFDLSAGGTVSITGQAQLASIWFGGDWAAALSNADSSCGLTGCQIDAASGWGAGPIAAPASYATITKQDIITFGSATYQCSTNSTAACWYRTADAVIMRGVSSGNPAASGASFKPSTRFLATGGTGPMAIAGLQSGNAANVVAQMMFDGGVKTVSGTCALTTAHNILTCASGTFASTDLGKPLQITQSGTTFTPSIFAVDSGTQVELTVNWTGTSFTTATVTYPYAAVGLQIGNSSTVPATLGNQYDHLAFRNLASGIKILSSVGHPSQNIDITNINCGDNATAANPVATCVDASTGPVFVLNIDKGRAVASDIPLRIGPDSSTTSGNVCQRCNVTGMDIETIGNAGRHNVLLGNAAGASIQKNYLEASATNTGLLDMVAFGSYGTSAAVAGCTATNNSTALTNCPAATFTSANVGQGIRISDPTTAQSTQEMWIAAYVSATAVTLSTAWTGTTTSTASIVFSGGSPADADVQNNTLVNDSRTLYAVSLANNTLHPRVVNNYMNIGGLTDLITDHASNSFLVVRDNDGVTNSTIVDSAINLYEMSNISGTGTWKRVIGGYKDTGNFSTGLSIMSPADNFNVFSLRSGFNSQPYMLSLGTNQAGSYTELQSWRSQIGYTTSPFIMQRQGGRVIVGGTTDDGASLLQVLGTHAAKHIGGLGTAPTLSCGAAIASSTNSDLAGSVNLAGGSACSTTLTITFNVSYAAIPHCLVSADTGTLTLSHSQTVSALTVTAAALSGNMDYICAQ